MMNIRSALTAPFRLSAIDLLAAVAGSDLPVSTGGVNGSYLDTHASDDGREEIREKVNNKSLLEHKWTIQVAGGALSYTLFLEAHHTFNTEGDDFVRVRRRGPLLNAEITTLPYPGFPTDLQAQLIALLARGEGISVVTEKIYPDRFMHVAELQRMGRRALFCETDVSDRASVQAMVERCLSEYGRIDFLMNNAGITRWCEAESVSEEDWRAVIDVNLNGLYNVLHPIVMPMLRRRKPGRIVTISSVSGLMGNRGQVNYSASKAGIIGATKALAIELAKRQITVNCVAPGLIESDMTDELPLEQMLEAIPLKRIGQAADIASAARYLLSSESSWMTGQVLSVDGGLSVVERL